MHPTPPTCWIAVLIVVLGIAAFVLDDTGIYLAAGLLALFLGVRYAAFISAFRSCIDGLTVERSVEPAISRQGSTVAVHTQVAIASGEKLSVTCRDLIPAGSMIESGTNTVRIDPATALAARTTYRLKMLAVGDREFGGLSIRGEDFFYSATVRYAPDRARAPAIRIFPAPLPVLPRDPPGFGEAGSARSSPLHGQSLLWLRQYVEGDDMRRIDWKASARHNRYIVRELSMTIEDSAFIVVDLPDRIHGSEEAMRVVSGAVGSRVESELDRKRDLTLLVFSGGDIVRFLPHAADREAIWDVVADFGPVERTHHLYRVLDDRTALRHFQAAERLHAGCTGERNGAAFSGSLSRIYRAFLDGPEPVVLNNRLFRIFEETECRVVDLYSTCDGDLSHLRAVCRQAEQRGVRVRLHAPNAAETMLHRLNSPVEVEVLR